MHIIPDTNIVFIHIPKTAGQWVRASFGMKSNFGAHSINEPEEQKYLGSEYVRFCVVRDPIKRFVSAYAYNTQISRDNPKSLGETIWSNGLQNDVNDLVRYLRETTPDIRKASIHFVKQTNLIAKTRPQIILRQENLNQDINIIKSMAPSAWIDVESKNVSDERFNLKDMNLELTEESRAFLESYFADDIHLLGYKKQPAAKRSKPQSSRVA